MTVVCRICARYRYMHCYLVRKPGYLQPPASNPSTWDSQPCRRPYFWHSGGLGGRAHGPLTPPRSSRKAPRYTLAASCRARLAGTCGQELALLLSTSYMRRVLRTRNWDFVTGFPTWDGGENARGLWDDVGDTAQAREPCPLSAGLSPFTSGGLPACLPISHDSQGCFPLATLYPVPVSPSALVPTYVLGERQYIRRQWPGAVSVGTQWHSCPRTRGRPGALKSERSQHLRARVWTDGWLRVDDTGPTWRAGGRV